MHSQFDRLILLLDVEAEQYQNLLACIQHEKRAIVNLDFDELTKIGGRKEAMILQLRRLSEQRTEVLQGLSAGLPTPPEDLTLGRLSREAPLPHSIELQRCRNRLRRLVDQLGTENENIKQLVRHGLALVRGSYHLISQLLDDTPVYQCTGNLQPAAASGRFHRCDY